MKLDNNNLERKKKKKGGNYIVEKKLACKGLTTCSAILPQIVALFCLFWGYFFFIVELSK